MCYQGSSYVTVVTLQLYVRMLIEPVYTQT
jgi:hypothetical protein